MPCFQSCFRSEIGERDYLQETRAALKLAAILIETKAPTTIEGTLIDPWEELLQHINDTLDGKPTKPRLEVLHRAVRLARR